MGPCVHSDCTIFVQVPFAIYSLAYQKAHESQGVMIVLWIPEQRDYLIYVLLAILCPPGQDCLACYSTALLRCHLLNPGVVLALYPKPRCDRSIAKTNLTNRRS
jgi:hypothetical protein